MVIFLTRGGLLSSLRSSVLLSVRTSQSAPAQASRSPVVVVAHLILELLDGPLEESPKVGSRRANERLVHPLEEVGEYEYAYLVPQDATDEVGDMEEEGNVTRRI